MRAGREERALNLLPQIRTLPALQESRRAAGEGVRVTEFGPARAELGEEACKRTAGLFRQMQRPNVTSVQRLFLLDCRPGTVIQPGPWLSNGPRAG